MLLILISLVTLAFTSSAPAGVAGSAPAITGPEAAALPGSAPEDTQAVPDHRRADFELRVAGEHIPYDVMAAFALPNEEVTIEVTSADSGFEVGAEAGETRNVSANRWSWRAPAAPGNYEVRVVPGNGQRPVTVNVFVMVPYDRMKKGNLAGYRIGEYPLRYKKGLAGYDRPRGFVEVNAENRDVLVAPHFTLGQFVCKQGEGFPKYVVLRPALLVKLERLLEVGREPEHRHDHDVAAERALLAVAVGVRLRLRGLRDPVLDLLHASSPICVVLSLPASPTLRSGPACPFQGRREANQRLASGRYISTAATAPHAAPSSSASRATGSTTPTASTISTTAATSSRTRR